MKTIQETIDYRKAQSIEILEKLLRNESVNRWSVYRLRRIIRELIIKEEKYQELSGEVESYIEMAKDSL